MGKKIPNSYIKNKCPKCGSLMEVRSHKQITIDELEKPYYYEEWYYCRGCGFLQHFENKKVINK